MPGCWQAAEPPEEPIGFFLSSRQDVLRSGRVVFIELSAEGGCPPQVAWDTTTALSHAIQAKRLFHVDLVRRTDPMCRDLPLESLEALSLQQLAQMRDSLQCDAVIFGRVNHFQPFPRMQLGLYVKLVNLKDGKLAWGVDHLWDTTDQGTERRIQRYFHRELRSGYEPIGYELVLKSPRAFERFVACEVAETLPPRQVPRSQPPTPNAGGETKPGGGEAKKTPETSPKPLK